MNLLFVSLGCDKNLVDTEHMLAMIARDGITLTNDETEADVIVVNSCCFISDAMEESIQTLIDLGQLKETARLKALIVTGCLAQRYEEAIRRDLPEVDAIVGTNAYDEIVDVIHEVLAKKGVVSRMRELSGLPENRDGRLLTTGGHFAYLKIAEGCDKRCTYCVIPSIRGDYRSVPMEDLLKEASRLAEDGVTELILVAQETTLYGVDLYGKKTLPDLLTRLSEISGIRWIRLEYCYPEEITEELVAAMAKNPKVCHYIDMPVQHCNDTILRRMGRKTSQADILDKIAMLRSAIPDICIRTTLICGFPGETKEAHEELMQFVSKVQFDRLGCFAYSQQEDTPAASFEDQIDEKIKAARVDAIMRLQKGIASEKNRSLIGRKLTVFVEGYVPSDEIYVTRTYRDAPDVDGYLFLTSDRSLMSGDFVDVIVTDAHEYDLIGELA